MSRFAVILPAAGRSSRFGGKGIKDDRRFAGPGHTGEDGDFAFRNAQRYILQVVFTSTSDFNIFLGHDYSLSSITFELLSRAVVCICHGWCFTILPHATHPPHEAMLMSRGALRRSAWSRL